MSHSQNSANPAANILRIIADSISDFLAPRHCVVCSEYTGHSAKYSKFVCDKCHDNLPFAPDKKLILNRFHSNFPENTHITEATSLFEVKADNNYLEIIHALKYLKFQSVAGEFGKLLSRRILIDEMTDYDFIIPIPIHKAKKRERGFNQSDLICKAVEKEIGIPVADNFVKRHKYTVTQTLLDKSGRQKNMENVFEVTDVSDTAGKSFLIIDDVLTTGSTINSTAKVLLESGAEKVGAATIALAGN
ncbi:MAG: ComF family protein [Candidatus Kapabacteria bacterium]|nr:ComF family protein [Ignavibacteriota bacterium]MCW5886086.1 ComF family protein [Candidatus Kapabacteria bacterium]